MQNVQWHRREPVVGIERVGADIARRDRVQGNPGVLRVGTQPHEIVIDRGRLSSCVGEQRGVESRDHAITGEE
jgi:hypothetical protein